MKYLSRRRQESIEKETSEFQISSFEFQDGKKRHQLLTETTSIQPLPNGKKLRTYSLKDTHSLQTEGESKDMSEEFEYITEGLLEFANIRVRCKTLIQLSERCLDAKYRQHFAASQSFSQICEFLS
eukprot:Sdes_comp15365_c0_seq1m4239